MLSAWAIALGLEPDPVFRADADGGEIFFTRAQLLFDLALQDHLHWKILLALFWCTGFLRCERSDDNEKESTDETVLVEQPPVER